MESDIGHESPSTQGAYPPDTPPRSSTPPIPRGTTPLAHQVAGHVFGRENGQMKNKHGFLQSEADGAVLKPVQAGGKGQRELLFYQEAFDTGCTDRDVIALRDLIPTYLGVWTTPLHPDVTYLRLGDLTRRFTRPCVMDVKVGPVTHEDDADPDKVLRERSKFPRLQQVGFQIVGIKVYDPSTDAYNTLERTFLRSLDEATISSKGLSAYFPAVAAHRRRLLTLFLRRLAAVQAWFLSQHSRRFIASSLLFVYEGAPPGRRQADCLVPGAPLPAGNTREGTDKRMNDSKVSASPDGSSTLVLGGTHGRLVCQVFQLADNTHGDEEGSRNVSVMHSTHNTLQSTTGAQLDCSDGESSNFSQSVSGLQLEVVNSCVPGEGQQLAQNSLQTQGDTACLTVSEPSDSAQNEGRTGGRQSLDKEPKDADPSVCAPRGDSDTEHSSEGKGVKRSAEECEGSESAKKHSGCVIREDVDLRMIDFTHVFPTQEPDENYLTGLRSLIRYLEGLFDA